MREAIITIPISEIGTFIPDKSTLIGCISHEDRCTSIAKNAAANVGKAVFFRNACLNIDKADTFSRQIDDSLNECTVITVDYSAPTTVADSFAKVIETLSKEHESLLIDTTTFTHETLAMLLKIVYRFRKEFKSICCTYVGAYEYSPGVPPEETWLSKGCKDVHNIIGFPGLLRPRAKTNLVIIAGFELERATRLIELIEPDKLTIGNGIDPICDNHSEKMRYFQGKFDHWKKEYKYLPTHSFEFSCRDIPRTVQQIKEIIGQNPDDNYILVPLNTKLSTIAAILIGLENDKIQLCYAVPETYNFENYSSTGDNVTIVDLLSFSIFAQ